ncbi:TonB-dependent receptor [Alkalitalea saponilacus]|uniref:TonB-dependent Receptor Plug Domain n=1 Tax=Alkalitalea saponilacus TaxID=889453 RepID=A0A1T5HQD0_9BACT|nr:TonB-dependent receptor [Alkalitalea saponilacus]ASB48442.1 TonB-dependent receptor [Alkalitalea saponilacus]SKC22915.1 TonB-dependent Receptor Plug Domain [Alkalitalea saponilacus]
MIKAIILLCVMMVFHFSLYSISLTQTVRGTVIDRQTQTTLPGANIVITSLDPQRGAVSNQNGYFRFENVPVGRISITVSFIGYRNIVLNNLELQSGRELVLNIELDQSGIFGEEVTITADVDKTAPINRLATVSARSFTVEETERYAGSFNDVARMAANFAGVMGNDDSRNDIIIRGNSPVGLLWKLDGVDVPNPNHWGMMGSTGGPVSMLNNTLLSNSDFFTGAFPAEYGNAISGVFDLRMRNGNNEQNEFLGQVGFNGFELGAEGPIRKEKGSSFLINYRYSTLALFERFGMDFGTVGVPYYQDISFKVNFPNTRLGRISLFGLGGKSFIEIWDSRKDTINERLDLYGIDGFDITSSARTGVVGLNQLYHINSNTYTRVTLAAMTQSATNKVDTITPETYSIEPFYRDNMTDNRLFASVMLNRSFSFRHLLRAGFSSTIVFPSLQDSIHRKYEQRWEQQFNHKGNFTLLQSYLQWQYIPIDEITLNTGINHQHNTLNGKSAFDPRLGIKWQPLPRHIFSFGYGMHHLTPSPILYFLQVNNNGEFIMPNRNLDFIRSRHLVMGYDFRINAFTRIKTEIYRQDISRAAIDAAERNAWSVLNQGASFQFELAEFMKSKGTGSNHGVELTLERFLNKGFYYLITASFFESVYKGSNEISSSTAFNNNHVVNALVGKEFEIRKSNLNSRQMLAFDFKTTHAGGMRTTPWTASFNSELNEYEREFDYTRAFSRKLKNYARTDFSITLKTNRGRITQQWGLEITNLFNRKNIFSESFNKQTGETEMVYQPARLIIPQYRILF